MAHVGLGLGYWLPRTEFGITLVRRKKVVPSTDRGSHVVDVVDVSVAPSAVEDPRAHHSLTIDAGLLEKLSLTISLDDRGFITGLNSESGRDVSPVLDLVGKAVGLAAAAVTVVGVVGALPVSGAGVEEDSLEQQWEDANPGLAALLGPLTAQSRNLLVAVTEADDPKDVVDIGAALEVVQSHLAAISLARRTWIADRNAVVDTTTLQLSPSELFQIDDQTLPSTLEDHTRWAAGGRSLSKEFNVIVAIADQRRDESGSGSEAALDSDRIDVVVLRRPRKAVTGVYLRVDGTWQLDASSVQHLDIVDEDSASDLLSLDGSWLRTKTFELAYHPDMSLKTFGFTSTPTASSVATATGGIADALVAAKKTLTPTTSAEQRQLDAAKTQLELLKTANEFDVLSATRARAAELAALEQQRAFDKP